MIQNYNKVLYIFGLGGHAKVILSEILVLGTYQEIIFIAPSNYSEVTIKINTVIYKVINNINDLSKLYNDNSYGVIGIGDISKRRNIADEILSKIPDFKWTSIISSNCIIADDALIEDGTVVVAGSIINTGTTLGKHCIVNTRATIDHDNQIGDYVNINPSVVTGGSVIIHDDVEIGIGSVIKNNIIINKNVMIGGNSFVNKDCISDSLYFGNPIKKIK
jgi:sugar O-acyltransferase (sialic acid O-acetyltransferase NeuD family)